jgi:hypothetical protein
MKLLLASAGITEFSSKSPTAATSTAPPLSLYPNPSRMFPLPNHHHHRKARGDPSVGVGGAWDVGRGPCADPGS